MNLLDVITALFRLLINPFCMCCNLYLRTWYVDQGILKQKKTNMKYKER